MFRDGQQVIVYLGEDRQMYINNSPGKSLCEFTGRVFLRERDTNILSITEIPDKFDWESVKAPPGWEIQGLEKDDEDDD
jgi:hypothetical protein